MRKPARNIPLQAIKSTRLDTCARQKVGRGGSDCSSFIPLKLFVFRSSRTKAGRQVKRPQISAKSSVVYVGRKGLRLLINPCFAQFKPVFFGLFFGLETFGGGFDSFNFYRLVQVAVKNQSPRVPLMLRCWNCHSINWMLFVSVHRRSTW